RRVFLGVSGILAAAVIVAGRPVLLPFLPALGVAPRLLPPVQRGGRLRVPRWAAILVVYALTLGTLGWFVSAIVPRLITEGRGLAAEWPELTAKARRDWLPAVDRKLAAWSGRPSPEPSTDANALPPPPEEKQPPLRVIKQPDGSYDVRV